MSPRPDAVPRISFGSVLSPRMQEHGDHAHGYILGLGQRPKASKGGLSLVKEEGPMKDAVYAQLEKALPALRSHALKDGESPYSDRGGHVAAFAGQIFSGIGPDDLPGMIEAIVENRPYLSPVHEMQFPRAISIEPPFRFDPDFLVPDALSSAGAILSEGRRVIPDESLGGNFFHLAHPMEPYLISVAALRARGISAYPAQAVIPAADGEHYHPLVAIVDLTKDVPLITFDLLQVHPPMGSVDILSDVAVKAVTFSMLADARIKHLTTEMVVRSKDGKELPMDELVRRLDGIADSLFECHKRWPGCHFIGSALSLAVEDVSEALVAINLGQIRENLGASARENFTLPEAVQHEIQASAMETAMSFARHIEHELALRAARDS